MSCPGNLEASEAPCLTRIFLGFSNQKLKIPKDKEEHTNTQEWICNLVSRTHINGYIAFVDGISEICSVRYNQLRLFSGIKLTNEWLVYIGCISFSLMVG
jgi:hypothetical protein